MAIKPQSIITSNLTNTDLATIGIYKTVKIFSIIRNGKVNEISMFIKKPIIIKFTAFNINKIKKCLLIFFLPIQYSHFFTIRQKF
jgi:hypothetical protein